MSQIRFVRIKNNFKSNTYDSTPFSFSNICLRSSSSRPMAISLKSTAVKYDPCNTAFKQCCAHKRPSCCNLQKYKQHKYYLIGKMNCESSTNSTFSCNIMLVSHIFECLYLLNACILIGHCDLLNQFVKIRY